MGNSTIFSTFGLNLIFENPFPVGFSFPRTLEEIKNGVYSSGSNIFSKITDREGGGEGPDALLC